MSVLESIAYGLVNLDEATKEQRKAIQHAARTEAHGLGYWVSGCKSANCCDPYTGTAPYGYVVQTGPHKLTRWNKNTFRQYRGPSNPRRPGIQDRNRPLHEGTFTDCCRALTRIITPSNPEK